ncbi:MAG: AMP-binding protein [Bacteroidota bacterium]|nr:AMP-binding protein [Bacteroidota bacterium]
MLKPGNVSELFFAAAEKWPAKPALIGADDRVLTFGELAEQVNDTAAYYRSKGIGKGDRVLLFVPMGIPLYRCILALFRIGAVAIFLDEWVSKERLEVCCRLAKCKVFIAPFKLRALALFSKEVRKIPVWLGPGYKKTAAQNFEQTTSDDTALITFTTGSTGIPKAADRTHGFLTAQFNALVDKINPDIADVDMPVLPIVLLLNLGTGVTSVIAGFNSRKPETIDTNAIWNQIVRHNVNRFTASPYVVERLAAATFNGKPAMRFFTGGAPVFPAQAATMLKGLPQSTIEIVYGSTEAEPISSIGAADLAAEQGALEKGLPVGEIYHGTNVLILPIVDAPIESNSNAELEKLALLPGNVGEITVSGAHVLQHYIENAEAEKRNKIFTDEKVWHRTGDAGFINEHGQLFLCGRCSTLIYVNGKMLAPFLWEGWFSSLPGIRMGTILEKGKQVIAVLQAGADCDKEEVKRKALRRFPFDKILFIEMIPRDPRHFSKIDYGKLFFEI